MKKRRTPEQKKALFEKIEDLISKGSTIKDAAVSLGLPSNGQFYHQYKRRMKKSKVISPHKRHKPRVEHVEQTAEKSNKIVCLIGTSDDIGDVLRGLK